MTLACALLLLAQTAPAASLQPEPSPTPLPYGPVVVFETSVGRIRIGLYKDKAPLTVENFLQYVRSGHYDGTIFHRVIPQFMIQGGGFAPDMTELPTKAAIRNESRNGLRNTRGSVAMARTALADSATAQFFINVKDNPGLDFGIKGVGYAVFGEVIEGMDVVDKIVAVPTLRKGDFENVPATPVIIRKVREETPAPPAAKPAAAAPSPKAQTKP